MTGEKCAIFEARATSAKIDQAFRAGERRAAMGLGLARLIFSKESQQFDSVADWTNKGDEAVAHVPGEMQLINPRFRARRAFRSPRMAERAQDSAVADAVP